MVARLCMHVRRGRPFVSIEVANFVFSVHVVH